MNLLKTSFCALTIILGFSVHAKSTHCVPNCIERNYNGVCMKQGPEFCGVDAQCVKRCVVRAFNGNCSEYAADFCGTNATCKVRCYPNHLGTCHDYGPDNCYTRD